MSNDLAIIPALGGSKEIKGKNIKAISGKPLVVWTLEQALTELGHSNVLLTTDNSEIFDVVKLHGHRFPYKRPNELATDTASTEPTMEDGDIAFKDVWPQIQSLYNHASFVPEIWQGHKNNGSGFWQAFDTLESLK